MFSIVETDRGKRCLLYDEYRYVCNRIRNTNTYWRCERLSGCRGCVIQRGDEEPTLTSPHNHDPDKEQFKSDLKQCVREGQPPPKKIYRTELINKYTTNKDVVCILPQHHQIKNTLYRTKNENYPSLRRSVNEISLDGMLDYTGNALITYKCAEFFR